MEGSSKRWPPLSFRLITGYKMLTGYHTHKHLRKMSRILYSELWEISHRSFFLFTKEPVSESTQEKAKAHDDFDACDRRRDVRSALMLIAVRYEVHAVVGYERGRAAKGGPDCFVEHGFAAFPGWLWCGAL